MIRVELTGETSYDRLVGTCYLPDGRDNGAEIIRAGKALDGSKWENWPVVLIVCVDMIGGGNIWREFKKTWLKLQSESGRKI